MNENNEKNFLPNDADNNNATEAFKAEFNDAVVKSSDNNATNPQEVVNESNRNSEAYKEHIDADANELDYKNQESDHHANLCDSVGNQDNISDSSDNEVVSDPNVFATDFTTVEEVRKKRSQKRKHSIKALIRESNLAVFLSALSVILLVALAALLSIGILPAGNRMVYVGVSTLGPIETQNGTAPAEMLENFKNSVVIIEVTRSQNGSTGSGIVISEDGYIVTNYHVIEGAKKISVKFYLL